jgi:hypothetical protein
VDCTVGEAGCKNKVAQEKRIAYLDKERADCANGSGDYCPDYVGLTVLTVGVLSIPDMISSASQLYQGIGRALSPALSTCLSNKICTTIFNSVFGIQSNSQSSSSSSKNILGEADICATEGNCASTNRLVVLGKWPKYLQVAEDMGGKTFSVPPDVFNSLTPEQQWELNKNFLDQAVARGDYFYLANPWAEATGWYERELTYLFEMGYSLSLHQFWLIPPSQ